MLSMEDSPLSQTPATAASPAQPGLNAHSRRRSGSGGGILSKWPFLRTADAHHKPASPKESRHIDIADDALNKPPRALAPIAHQSPQQQQQQLKTRKRKGSLRKVALLGRGAQRDRRDLKPLITSSNMDTAAAAAAPSPPSPPVVDGHSAAAAHAVVVVDHAAPTPAAAASASVIASSPLGLGISDITPRPSMDGFAHRADLPRHHHLPPPMPPPEPRKASPTRSYASTTDDEDVLSLQSRSVRPGLSSISSGSESYFPKPARKTSVSLQRRRSVKHTKSPLSLQGLTASPLPVPDAEYDYSETEWWGWVILIVTWVVFVVGMGSSLGVWSWAWDVGTTPYAPPEFEDDPTLPIVGYYPALMILTCIMAWVWVVTAWVGMKYFRHAKITGD